MSTTCPHCRCGLLHHPDCQISPKPEVAPPIKESREEWTDAEYAELPHVKLGSEAAPSDGKIAFDYAMAGHDKTVRHEPKPPSDCMPETGNCTPEAYEAARAEVEILRVQLAGCGVAALCNTRESTEVRAKPGDYGYSQSYKDVCDAVDREIQLREENSRLRDALKGGK